MKLDKFIIQIANNNLTSVKEIKNGHNGLYNDPETKVRNVSHYLLIAAKCYELTNSQKYLKFVKEYADFLISKKSIPCNYSFDHRNKKGKDRCNGLMGQAWSIEALAKASELLNNKKYSDVAVEVFNRHSFNKKYGLWYRLEPDGKILSYDMTFNHQLWFAACGLLLKNTEIDNKVLIFMNKLRRNLSVMNNGLLFHSILAPSIDNKKLNFSLSRQLKSIIKAVILIIKNIYVNNILFLTKVLEKDQIQRSLGYLGFNLYAFAIIKKIWPKNNFWTSKKFNKMLTFFFSEEYRNLIEDNKYGYPYNPVGFEAAFISSVFLKNEKDIIRISEEWINIQLKLNYNNKDFNMSNNNPDPEVLTARLYELCRIPDKIIKKINIETK